MLDKLTLVRPLGTPNRGPNPNPNPRPIPNPSQVRNLVGRNEELREPLLTEGVERTLQDVTLTPTRTRTLTLTLTLTYPYP